MGEQAHFDEDREADYDAQRSESHALDDGRLIECRDCGEVIAPDAECEVCRIDAAELARGGR